MTKIETPCNKVCTVDRGSGLCLGCARTLAEIEHWMAFNDGERARIARDLPRRLEAMRLRRTAVVRP
jgi:predicted Fe-S protein YdhL (DUF1289 family)